MVPASRRDLLASFFEEFDIEAGAPVGIKLLPKMASLADLIQPPSGGSVGVAPAVCEFTT